MSIYTQICALSIVLLLTFFYKRQPIMGLKSEQRFQLLLVSVIASMTLDIISRLVFYIRLPHDELLTNALSKLYLVSLCFLTFSALRYALSDIVGNTAPATVIFRRIAHIVTLVIICILICVLPISHNTSYNVVFSEGPAVVATSLCCTLVILTIIAEVYIHKNKIKIKRRNAIMDWMILWLIAAVIEFFFPRLILTNFISCIGVLIIFFEIENPEAALSRRTGHFSSAVIREYFDFLYKQKESFSTIMISFATVGDSTQDSECIRAEIIRLSEFLFEINNAKIFDTAEGYFILVFNSQTEAEKSLKKIKFYFEKAQKNPDTTFGHNLLNPFFTIVEDCDIVTNSDELLSLFSEFTPTIHKNYNSNEIRVDSKKIFSLRERKRLEDMVVSAIENDRVEVYYQPIYNLQKGTFSSAEGLVRIRLEDGTLAMPGSFIPIIEESGRIIPLSNAIYKKAFSFMKSYHLERLGIDYIELNLSVRQGDNPAFADSFKEMMAKYSIPGCMVNLEITETSSLNSRENMLINMSKLETVGVTFSLDDFGSGSSNLNYIIDMPVKTVKLDKSLTDAYFKTEKANAIVKAVVNMAHSIGITIVAEGIETKEQLNEMKLLGIDFIQGYYFSKPLCEREFLAFLQKNNL